LERRVLLVERELVHAHRLDVPLRVIPRRPRHADVAVDRVMRALQRRVEVFVFRVVPHLLLRGICASERAGVGVNEWSVRREVAIERMKYQS
jgi:hypothetical protein